MHSELKALVLLGCFGGAIIIAGNVLGSSVLSTRIELVGSIIIGLSVFALWIRGWI